MDFNGIVGHERPRGLLSSIFEKNRFSHALLFSGPPGVGKCTMAVELVKHLFCEKRTACGACRACQNVMRNAHPDLHTIRSETSIGIDELRGVRKEVYESPYEAPLRVILIDGAEQMTHEAANALLKTLEEPPPLNLFLLVTSSEKDVPLTIRSRCMRIGFGPISREEIKSHFVENVRLPERKAELLASLSWGSMSSAFFWMDENNFAMRRRLAEFVTGKKRGFVTATGLSEIITSYEKGLRFYLYFLLSLFRDLWVVNEAGDIHTLVNSDLRELLESSTWDGTWIERSMGEIQRTLESLRYNINRWLTFEHLVLSIMR
jgi:DNA polymerase-3 subunit delta'